MKTGTRNFLGRITIFNRRTFEVYIGPLKDRAHQVKDTITFDERLCGRAIVQLAAGFAALIWEDCIAGRGDWTDGDSIAVGSEKWKIRVVKRLPKELKGQWGVSSSAREIFVCRGTAGDMAMGAMLGTDYAWKVWQLQALRAAIDPKPEQLPAADCASFQTDWDAVVAKITEAA